MLQRHTEHFGPDFARGPYTSQRIESAALQIATALAQLRAPVSRADADLQAHADFIRTLADRLAPDFAAQVLIDVGEEQGNAITSAIAAVTGTYSLLECWLADSPGGGETVFAPAAVTWTGGSVLQTVTANKHWLIVTPYTGQVSATVNHTGAYVWYWAVSRMARVYYSAQLYFE